MIEVSGIPISLDAMLPENAHLQIKEVARALKVDVRDIHQAKLAREERRRAKKVERALYYDVRMRLES